MYAQTFACSTGRRSGQFICTELLQLVEADIYGFVAELEECFEAGAEERGGRVRQSNGVGEYARAEVRENMCISMQASVC